MLKDEERIIINNDQIQGHKICTLLILYEELVKFIIGLKFLVIGPFSFLRPSIFFEFVW